MSRIESRRELYVCLWRIVTLLSGTRCSQLHIMNTNEPTTRLTGQLLPPEASPSSSSDLRASLSPPSPPPSLCVSLPLTACALHLYCCCLSCVRWCQVDLFSPRRSGCRQSRPLRAAAGSPLQLQLRSAGRATFVGVVFTHRFPIWRKKSRACRCQPRALILLFCLLKSKLQVAPCKFTWLWYSRMECRVSWATSLSVAHKFWLISAVMDWKNEDCVFLEKEAALRVPRAKWSDSEWTHEGGMVTERHVRRFMSQLCQLMSLISYEHVCACHVFVLMRHAGRRARVGACVCVCVCVCWRQCASPASHQQ